jgi:pimeloyl-ACP methyl ester carboxylesterase
VSSGGRHGIPLAATFDAVGPEGAPAIVFLHGTRLTRAMWRPQLPLADSYRLVMTDLPGHGSLARVPFTLPDASAHASRVIDAVVGGRAVVVGQSLGGYVAMDLAARHPERVRALVLCNCTQEPRTIARTAPGVIGGYLAGAAAQSWRPGRGQGEEPGAADPALLRHHEPPTEGWLFKGGTRALFTSLGMTFIPRLRAFAGPTLIINGAGDRLFRRGEARFLAAAADGRLVIIDGARHVTSEEAPDIYNAIVRSFVEELGSR